ncbi:MAG: hypothetical protein GY906_22890 [bacterium]|nr:hypothetical protein [bacterium]
MYVTNRGTLAGVPCSRPPGRFALGGYDDVTIYAPDDEGGLGLFGIALPAIIGGAVSVGKSIFGGGGNGGRSAATIAADAADQMRYYQMALAGDTTTIVEGMTAEARLRWEASPANAGNPQEVAGATNLLRQLDAERARKRAEAERLAAERDAQARAAAANPLTAMGSLFSAPTGGGGLNVNTLLLAGMGGLLMFTLLGKRR